MKRKNALLLLVMSLGSFIFLACSTAPAFKVASGPYKIPTAKDKNAIMEIILKAELTWNARNEKAFLNLFSEDARIMFGRKQKVMSKIIFAKMFPAAFDEAGIIRYDRIKLVGVKQNIAKVNAKVSISSGGGDFIWLEYDIFFIKETNDWKIIDSIYNIHFKRVGDRPQPRGVTLE